MSNLDSSTNQPRLLSFTLDGWSVLGDRVTVSLHDGVAVLVGRNGSGKSAIIEGFEAISSFALGKFNQVPQNDINNIPKILEIELLTPTHRRLKYNYEVVTISPFNKGSELDYSTVDDSEEDRFSWNDWCQYIDEQKEILWTTKSGVTTLNNDGDPITIVSTSLFGRLHITGTQSLKSHADAVILWIRAVLQGINILNNSLVRRRSTREEEVLKVPRKTFPFKYNDLPRLILRQILILMETEKLDELKSVCQRIGLGKITELKSFQEEGEYIFSVKLDGVDIGLLSDGTLRVLSILTEIIASNQGKTIIIEEPEAQIHPAMLGKLLNEIETYTYGQNLIISTHSPQVVAWASPEKINLVHRKNGQTFVRKLAEDDIHSIIEYLSEEGNLGEWIYSGILDE
ncbi:MAG: ATP-binding protein [Pseudanabaena sp.]|nr:MAG: ATP-binding protein [Pseudanabaena sp.]